LLCGQLDSLFRTLTKALRRLPSEAFASIFSLAKAYLLIAYLLIWHQLNH